LRVVQERIRYYFSLDSASADQRTEELVLAVTQAMAATQIYGELDAALQRQIGDVQRLTELQQALQRAEFVREEDRRQALEVQRFVKDTTTEILSKRIELRIAQLALAQAVATLDDRNHELRRVFEDQRAWRALDAAAEPVFQDPTLRIIRDGY